MAGPSGATTRLQLPYPTPDDTVDVPRDVKALADRLEITTQRNGLAALTRVPILDVGLVGQRRAGRELAVADFTALGLAQPVGLWNLSNLVNLGSDGRSLVNKGTVPFGLGINGLAATAAVFAGSTAQVLYIVDSGAADPFRIRTGSIGCWMRTAKRGTSQVLLSKLSLAVGQYVFGPYVHTSGVVNGQLSVDGSTIIPSSGVADVADDRWHFVVQTWDGTAMRVYVDGVIDSMIAAGPAFPGSGPLNIGGQQADGTAATGSPFYGRVDEAFITADALSEDQIRALYCAKVAHGYAEAPTRVNVNVTRRKRGGPLVVADFPTQPLRLHNFSAGSLADEGSNNVALTNNGAAVSVAGADGTPGGAFSYAGAQSLSATDAGLPAALTARSFGCWFKTALATGTMGVMGWGTLATGEARLYVGTGTLANLSATDTIAGPFVADVQWHFVVMAEDNAAGDGVRRKMYLDGRLVGVSTVLNAITLAGANRFRVGSTQDGTQPFSGQIDGAFVCGYALTFEQIAALYAKGSQALMLSPKNAGDHVEAMDATNVLATFDTLETSALIDMGVQA